MQVVPVDPAAPAPAAIAGAAAELLRGGLVAFPTETVYGLGANALDVAAVHRLFAAKGRPSHNPLIVHLPEAAAARELAREWPAAAARLAAAFWPGPLTLVVAKRDVIGDAVTAGLDSVALRVPAHPVALALLRAAGVPVAAPSANPSTSVSPTAAEHVVAGLGHAVALVLDAGRTTLGIESTVVDVRGERPVILRPGFLSAPALERVVGPLASPDRATAGPALRSPGLLERHYAPNAELRLATSAPEAAGAVAELRRGEGRVGALLHSAADVPAHHTVRLPSDPVGYANGLYAALHALDALGCRFIVAEAVPPGPEWAGVRDRLSRAARR
jgi:L-threonylcarbamoyladenylate synthase